MAVDPQRHRTSIASHLLLAQAVEAIRRECPAWTLEVRVSSVGAQELYSAMGYSCVGTRSGYYPDGEDGLVMTKRFGHLSQGLRKVKQAEG